MNPERTSTTPATSEIEVSVVIPCLNEAETIGVCIEKAQQGISEIGAAEEVIVADNDSTDDSVAIAQRLGGRAVSVAEPGYGSALMGGIEATQGKFVVMGNADDSYDFREIPRFLAKLREGCQLVQGCRLPSGGGKIGPGAMPTSHLLIGNPLFSLLGRAGSGRPRTSESYGSPPRLSLPNTGGPWARKRYRFLATRST